MSRAITGPIQVPHFWLPCLLALLSSWSATCRGERVHFRIHAGDILDQHTHMRTVLLHPGGETMRNLRQLHAAGQGVPPVPPGAPLTAQNPLLYLHGPLPGQLRANPQQAVSFIRQTLQVPLQQQQPQQQSRPQQPRSNAAPVPGGHIPSPGLGATLIPQVPITPIIPLRAIPGGGHHLSTPRHVVLPAAGPHPALANPGVAVANPAGHASAPASLSPAAAAPAVPAPGGGATKQTPSHVVTHQMSGPGPWPMHLLLPHGPNGELVPMRLVAVGVAPAPGWSGKAAALLAPPSTADLKKGKGCKAFIRAGDDPEVGDCFLEEYENGYNEERSKKTFFGGDNSSSKTERDGSRNSKRYKNESKFVHNPKVRPQWVRVRAPDAHHLVHAEGGPLFTASDGQGGQGGRKGRGRQRGAQRGSKARPTNNGKHKVTLVRLPPGATAVTTVLQGQRTQQEDEQDVSLDEDDDKAPQQSSDDLDNQQRQREDDGLVEVFKNSARAAPITAPLVAVSAAKPMWVQEYHPMRMKPVEQDNDEDEFEVEESAPMAVVTSPEQASARGAQPRPPLHPQRPRALDDMDLSWSSGFTDGVFDSDDGDDKADMQSDSEDGDFDHSIDDSDRDSEAQTQSDDDGGDTADHDGGDHDADREQDHAASEIVNGVGDGGGGLSAHTLLRGRGPAERMLHQRGRLPFGMARGGEGSSPRLSAIVASGGHVFDPPTPPAPHPAAFGAKDPDRLEAGRKVPVVLEFGHELSGYKESQQKQIVPYII